MSDSVALFVMGQDGHVKRMLPLIQGIAARGDVPHVFTDVAYRSDVERAGGRFVDIFAGRPLDEADAESTPLPCRFVSFAGCFAEDVARELREIGPTVILYDTFAVIGRVVGKILGLPHVNVCCGHNREVGEVDDWLPLMSDYLSVSPACERWVEVLRERYGLEDASPWCWTDAQSEHLNLYCEPPGYLDADRRESLEPIAFFGSLPEADDIAARLGAGGDGHFNGGAERVYLSFGTLVWRFFGEQVLGAMRAASEALAERDAGAVISLGGMPVSAEARRELTAPNVVVADFVDQWQVLAGAGAFVTHHGLNSTHEAVWSGVPMISYPFFGDQPSQAAKCAGFGFATSLVDAQLGAVGKDDVHAALDRVAAERDSMRAALATGREWEAQVMAERPAVLDRVLALGSA